jgi:hypothetical protein
MEAPKIALCTTCKGRLDHIKRTLPQNILDNADYENLTFVVLNYNSPDQLTSYLKEAFPNEISSGRVVVYHYSGVGKFHMAHAKNLAHRLGVREQADILVNLDADNYTGPGFASYIAREYAASDPAAEPMRDLLLWSEWVRPEEQQVVGERGIVGARGISGRIVVSSHSFLKVGGYDEAKYPHWGPDDLDFHIRVRRLGVETRKIERRYLSAIRHTEKMRFREYPHARALADYSAPLPTDDIDIDVIANYGRVGCGVVFRNFDPYPIVLDSIPTRIFGIGMHKTATTSLHAALKTLRYDSVHWRSSKWSKMILDEVRATGGKSPTIEDHYATSDLPLQLIYKELDRAYPGSKFILTTRDEHKWVKSVENHWRRHDGFLGAKKGSDRFSRLLHEEIYGQADFDRELFLSRYRRHNAEVREYFKSRPNDLLVMDMEIPTVGWLELCGFLRQPMPDMPYPREFVTSAQE